MTELLFPLLGMVAAGVVAGLLAGLLGIGGGLVFVPALLFVFRASGVPAESAMHLAVGSSLTAIVLTSITSFHAHARRGNVDMRVFRAMSPGLVAGALGGAALAAALSGGALRLVFGAFLLLVAVQVAIGLRPATGRRPPTGVEGVLAGGGIGTLSAMLGIGGGTLTVPYLAWCGLSMLRAVGTAAAAGLPLALAGAAGFAVAGWNAEGLPAYATGYIAWPAVFVLGLTSMAAAPVGAGWAQQAPARILRLSLAGVLALVGLRLLSA